MNDSGRPDILVERLHIVQNREGLTIKEMAERCGLPKSSLESYMRVKGPKRPGIDALLAISEGMGVSIDWLVGRSIESFAPNLRQRDYALGCFNIVMALLHWLRKEQEKAASSILAQDRIAGNDDATIAARSMMEFVETMQAYAANGHRFGNIRADLQAGLEEALSKTETGN
ncbi:helix-turn-helix domain-containing protein [Rhodovulum sp. P5]|uniref:helix-turn-helix domain-containing protein n=1 Tax=Rhodovulum sp. P5 TaxID=1564506 RepID=UPI0009DA4FA4|nr:helix-turn-helix transcriptional regulator [Rhodovulum sp. P5]